MNSKKRHLFIIFTLLSIVSISLGQKFKLVENQIKNFDYLNAKISLEKIEQNQFSTYEKAKYYRLKGLISSKLNNSDEAFRSYLLSKKYFIEIDSIDSMQDVNLQLASIVGFKSSDETYDNRFINEYLNYALKKKDNLILVKAYKQLATSKIFDSLLVSIKLYKKALRYNEKANSYLLYSEIYNNLGNLYNEFLFKHDSALYYLKRSNFYYSKLNHQNGLCYNLINQASSYSYLKDNHKAIELLKKADSIPIKEFKLKVKTNIYYNLLRCYDSIKDYKNGFIASKMYLKYKESLDEEKKDIAINDIQVKYQTKEKDLENVSLKNKLETNHILLIIGFGVLLTLLLVGVLAYKNLSKKKKIAEQEKLIQTQKLEKQLKDLELHEIDVMLEAQEKERQNIADELHDNIGSMLATLKLNFQNLKQNVILSDAKSEKLLSKTDKLIEETYQEIRNISHLKNLGLIGNEGLVIALKKMVEKISISKKLQINLIPFGLNERIENQKEILIYRMIQEMCTNILKHSEASEVNIYLTKHNSELNIIIEDNGIGFNVKDLNKKNGIGLKNIEQKVEQMNGTFTIDSIVSKGTTIIIDLPI